jgi:hypothetical protein
MISRKTSLTTEKENIMAEHVARKVATQIVNELSAPRIAEFLRGFTPKVANSNGDACGNGCGAGCRNAQGIVIDPEGKTLTREELVAAAKDHAELRAAIKAHFATAIG